MLISIVVSLYTSRVILITLGIDDFGIYNVVGGVVAIFTFLNTSMSGATSRFITFELGKGGGKQSINDVFSSVMTIHLLIAVVILILGETIGLYLLKTKLIFPAEKEYAAEIVYQLSLFSVIISVLQVPYNASIIAYERMNIYAYIEILRVLLRLGIAYLLLLSGSDRLILYGFLVLFVSIIITSLYYAYCIRRLKTCHFYWIWNKKRLLPIFNFSAWDLYGNACVAIREQGTVVLINNFFGIALNAAAGIANQAGAAVSVFTNSVTMAFRPQVIKEYANGNIRRMESLLSLELSVCIFLISLVVPPLYLYMQPVMELWLKEVPEYAVQFCRMILLINIILIINGIFVTCIHATGNIKNLSLVGGSLFIIALFFSYLFFKMGFSVMYAYYGWFVFSIIILIADVMILKKQITDISLKDIIKPQLRPIICVVLSLIGIIYLSSLLKIDIYMFIVIVLINTILLLGGGMFLWVSPVYGNNVKTILKLLFEKDNDRKS